MPYHDVSPIKLYGESIAQDSTQHLFIPPDALAIQLDVFEGPLDVLLFLIKQQRFYIDDLPIAQLTQQYLAYLQTMQQLHIDIAAEYLVMATHLIHLKSQLLLPSPALQAEAQEDPEVF